MLTSFYYGEVTEIREKKKKKEATADETIEEAKAA